MQSTEDSSGLLKSLSDTTEEFSMVRYDEEIEEKAEEQEGRTTEELDEGTFEQSWREEEIELPLVEPTKLVTHSLEVTVLLATEELVAVDDNLTSMSSSEELSAELLSIKPESLSSSSRRSLSSSASISQSSKVLLSDSKGLSSFLMKDALVHAWSDEPLIMAGKCWEECWGTSSAQRA